MPRPPSSRSLLVVLSASLAVALMVIAFLLGRESARAPAIEAKVPAPIASEPEPVVQNDERPRWPEWADLEEWEDVEDPTFAIEPVHERIERRPDGTLVLSNRGAAPAASQATSDSPNNSAGSISAYFGRMDVIHGPSGAGDPNTFAMGLIKAGLGGSTTGFDQLIADTERMEQEIRAVTPPPSCAAYHEANLEALAESREILEEMKIAFARRDFSKLSAIAQQAGTLQARAETLQDMREKITAGAAR